MWKCSARNLLGEVDLLRIAASLKQDQKQKGKLGQFLTPAPVAELMVGMFGKLDLPQISLLDAGAGVGSLLAAFVAKHTGFIAATVQLLESRGELVAISPRSFCNGPYFRDFRRMFLEMMALDQIHLFESRQEAFSDDEVLQETIIIHAVKQKPKFDNVIISKSSNADDDFMLSNSLAYTEIVLPNDSQQFIHIIPDTLSQQVIEKMANFTCTLKDLELTVSTGRVVDFRAKQYLYLMPKQDTVPLIYPLNFSDGYIEYPKVTKKHQALLYAQETVSLLVPNEHYVLTKRFSSKEEKKELLLLYMMLTK